MAKEYALFLSGMFDRLEFHEEKPRNIDHKGVVWVEVNPKRHKYTYEKKKLGWVIERGKAICYILKKSKKVSEIISAMSEEEFEEFRTSLSPIEFYTLVSSGELYHDSALMKTIVDRTKKMKRIKEILY